MRECSESTAMFKSFGNDMRCPACNEGVGLYFGSFSKPISCERCARAMPTTPQWYLDRKANKVKADLHFKEQVKVIIEESHRRMGYCPWNRNAGKKAI